ncbi:polysaccharide deacetylase family protein [Allorhizobium terrae]|uniref:Chitooligosaccharide deacetylase n=1 Tax=Allorhizobium terrae TaxID=1848972 RepID=A0A4S3ZSD3_9HYPH|nr:polysaccharide deacetylase family protein [Allorhizobium terrae]THF48579.1 polysaccharide deacetylase [Allorhizobium terrae]
MSEERVKQRLDALANQGQQVTFWLRDDDAIEPTPALETLLHLASRYQIPLTLAVIPQNTGAALVERVVQEPALCVSVHGWSHVNHATPPEKKQELGLQRPAAMVLNELKAGFDKLRDLYGAHFLPMLVPPWNRIDARLLPELSALGFSALSVFGREKVPAPMRLLNTHVDVMDWRGTGGGRDADALFAEIADWLAADAEPLNALGLLTHHLVHDAAVWRFLERLFQLTHNHPGCRWMSARAILATA